MHEFQEKIFPFLCLQKYQIYNVVPMCLRKLHLKLFCMTNLKKSVFF